MNKEKIKSLRAAAKFKCKCEMCPSRYCDDDIDKARAFRKEIPMLLDGFERLNLEKDLKEKENVWLRERLQSAKEVIEWYASHRETYISGRACKWLEAIERHSP